MGMKSLIVPLPDGRKVGLRLTLAGQKAMKALDPDGNVIENIMAALDDPAAMGELLTQCLNWKGNENSIHDGEELYDALVDAGKAGVADFGGLILDICRGAGILRQEDCERVNRIITKAAKAQSKQLEDAAAEDEGPPIQEGPADPLSLETLDG